jgi:hypothetical protein
MAQFKGEVLLHNALHSTLRWRIEKSASRVSAHRYGVIAKDLSTTAALLCALFGS